MTAHGYSKTVRLYLYSVAHNFSTPLRCSNNMDGQIEQHPAFVAIAQSVLLTMVLGQEFAYLRQFISIPEGIAQLARETFPNISAVGAYVHGLNGLLWSAMEAIENGMGVIEALIHSRLLPVPEQIVVSSSESSSSSDSSSESETEESESEDSDEDKENSAPAEYQQCKQGRPSSGYWSDEDPGSAQGPSPKVLRSLRHLR